MFNCYKKIEQLLITGLLIAGLASCENSHFERPHTCGLSQESKEKIDFFDTLVFGQDLGDTGTIKIHPFPKNFYAYAPHSLIPEYDPTRAPTLNEKRRSHLEGEDYRGAIYVTNLLSVTSTSINKELKDLLGGNSINYDSEATMIFTATDDRAWTGFDEAGLLNSQKNWNMDIYNDFKEGREDCVYWKEKSGQKSSYRVFNYVNHTDAIVKNPEEVLACYAGALLLSHGFKNVMDYPPDEILNFEYKYFRITYEQLFIAGLGEKIKWALLKIYDENIGIQSGGTREDILEKITDSEKGCNSE